MTALNDEDFTLLREWLRATAGLEFDESRRTSLAFVVGERLRATGLSEVAAYVRLLDRADGAVERQHLLDDVTIQETHFHRARPQIDALRDHLLPNALSEASIDGRALTVWSAGCSTGEEAYTLAMLALEARELMQSDSDLPPPAIRVVGTDVSTAALDVARTARYGGRTVDLAEQAAVTRWLRAVDNGEFEVRDEVRELVEFAQHNLVTEPPPFVNGSVDLVVCRNVTIYFSRETTRELVARFKDCLAPQGWLLMGPAETLWQLSDAFTLAPVGEAFAYRPTQSRRVAVVTALPDAPPIRRPVPLPTAASLPSRRGAPARSIPRRRPARTGVELLSAARAALADSRYGDAAALASQACAVDPLLTEAYVVAGQAQATLGRDAEALVPLGRAVYLDSRAGHAWFLLAGSLARTGDRAAAARAYRAAAAALPSAPPEAVLGLLDGAAVGHLVQLCTDLADDLEGSSELRRGA